MAFQLIYTSYSTSLVQGRTGFSTVARSSDMPERLVLEVERVSQYDIEAGSVFSHRIVECGVRYHILTRTKDCGVDYTNRNNYIAHHLIFSDAEAESVSVNPAEILLGYDKWLDSFSGEPRFLSDIHISEFEKLPKLSLPAQNWRSKFGDCAYAASLGNSASIFAQVGDSHMLLRLYAESLHLLTHKKADWSISFTTHIFPSEKTSDFAWYASSNGDENYIVDIVRSRVNCLPQGRMAEYARSGLLSNAEKYNLKVANRIPNERHFNVVEQKPKPYIPIFIGIAVSIVIIVVALVYCLSGSKDSDKSLNIPPKQERLIDIKQDKQFPKKEIESVKISLSKVISLAREKIDSGNFAEAMAYWNSQPYAKTHKQYEDELRADINAKISSLLRYAENVSLNPLLSEFEKTKALRNLSVIEASIGFADANTRIRLTEKISEIRRILNKEK